MLHEFWVAIGEVLPSIWKLMIVLFCLSIIMQQIINRLPLMCQSVHVIHVPWGILWVTMFAYLWGVINYRQAIALALLYLSAYPFMWWLNYKFTQQLSQIMRERRVSRATTGQTIWANEVLWIWRTRRFIKQLFGRSGLNDEICNRILDYHGHNGYHRNDNVLQQVKTRDD